MSRIRRAAALIGACAIVAALSASAAAAKTVTMHFFSKGVYSRMSDASGKPLPANATPAAGDRLTFGSDDFAGNHKHHAKRATASDRIDCTIMSDGNGLCDGTIAIGGAMLLGDDFVLNFNANVTTVKITGGTGRYRGAHGTVIATGAGNNTDLTIKVSS